MSVPETAIDLGPSRPEPIADDELKTIRDRFEDALSASAENRASYIEDVRFSCSADQWDANTKIMRGACRPALTFNRLNGVIKNIIGDYRQNKLAIKVLPASGEASEDMADILAGLIRNIEQQSNADMAYVNALECSARGGFGYYRIVSKYTGDDSFDQDLAIEPIHNPLTVYFDPAARKLTREDANWAFVTEMVSRDVFEALYPEADTGGFKTGGMDHWATNDDVRIAEYYEKEAYTCRLGAFSNGMVVEIQDDSEIEALERIGLKLTREREARRTKIVWKKMTATEILDRREYKIKYIPIIPVIGEEVNLEGKVYTRSAIYYAKDAQRQLNYQKSTAVELTALAPRAPWIGTAEHFQGLEDQWANANTTPLAYLTYNADPSAPQGPQRIQPAPQPVAEIAMAGDAGVELQYTTGVFDANLGSQQSKEVSGVALGERQQQGATSTVLFVDNLRKSIEHGGKILLDWIPLVYDAERVIRILDMEGNPKTETVNQEQYDPMTGVTQVLNSITTGKYDVVIDTGPNFASRRKEALQAMMQLAQSYPQMMAVAGDLVVKQIDAPGMEQIAERIKRSLPPQVTTDPDSPEGKAMANQPPPVPPEVQMEQAKTQSAMQLEDKRLQNSVQLEQIKTQNAAQLAQSQQESQGEQDAQAQRIESQRELMAMREQAETETKQMLINHKLELDKIRAESVARLAEIEAKAHADAQASREKTIAQAHGDHMGRLHQKDMMNAQPHQ